MFRVAALAFAILSPVQGDWIAWMTQDPVKVAQTYVEEMIPAFKALDVVTMERLFSVHCVFGNPDAGEPGQQADTLMMGLKSAGLDHGNKEFREKLAGITIMSAVNRANDGTGGEKPDDEGILERDFRRWFVQQSRPSCD